MELDVSEAFFLPPVVLPWEGTFSEVKAELPLPPMQPADLDPMSLMSLT